MAWPAGGFGIDESWLRIGLKFTAKNPNIFNKDSKEEAMLSLGLGNVQIEALRDWLIEARIIENKGSSYRLTDIGKVIHEFDPDISEDATLWIIHYHLALKEGKAWFYHWYINEFEIDNFNRVDLKNGLSAYKPYAINHIEKYALAPLLQTMRKTRIGKSFGIMIEDTQNKFKRIEPKEDRLDPIIVAYMTIDWAKRNDRISANLLELTNSKGSPGKILHLSTKRYSDYLDKIQSMFNKEIFWVSYTAGLNSVAFEKNIDQFDILKTYYIRKLNELNPLDAFHKAQKGSF